MQKEGCHLNPAEDLPQGSQGTGPASSNSPQSSVVPSRCFLDFLTSSTSGVEACRITLRGGDDLSAGINLGEDPDEKGGRRRRRPAAIAAEGFSSLPRSAVHPVVLKRLAPLLSSPRGVQNASLQVSKPLV